MPKQRQTCTRCSQRRQKCDRKDPCTRCVQNNEGHLCSTKWAEGYNPSVHRKYPRRSSPTVSWQSAASSSDTSSSALQADGMSRLGGQDLPSSRIRTSNAGQGASLEPPNLPTKLPDITIGSLLLDKDQSTQSGIFDQSFDYVKSKGTSRDSNGTSNIPSCYSALAKASEVQHLQSILPSKERLLQITEYYEQYR